MSKQILGRFAALCGLTIGVMILSLPESFYAKQLGEDHEITQTMSRLQVALGLDLQGGTELDYKIDLSEAIAQNTDDDEANDINLDVIAESVRDALESRVNPAGVGEIIVKRAQVEGEEHVLIQMPPNTDVAKAKRDAETDNKLEFFAENPYLENQTRLKVAGFLTQINTSNFEEKALELTKDSVVSREKFGPIFISEILDKELASKLEKASAGNVLQNIIDTRIQPQYSMSEDGTIEIQGEPFARDVIGIAKVDEVVTETREVKTEAEASARHILFAYTGALRAAETVPYSTADEAKNKAQEVLDQIKSGGNFTDLAKEFSTGPSGKNGGDLGVFAPGTMAEAFNDAVFGTEENTGKVGLVEELVETDFGFHIIEVLSLAPEKIEQKAEKKVSYSLIAWDKADINWEKTKLGGKQLDAASVGYDQLGNALVNLRFDMTGGKMFADLTGSVAQKSCDENMPCRIQIRVGGNPVTAPTVREKILGRNAQITGNFTFESAHELANQLNLGAIDAPVILSGQTTIGAQLGEEQLAQSLKAGILGLVATILFMLLIYRFTGVIAALALIIYSLMFLAILKLWPGALGGPIVLSLAGAAGIILSIGLAVDGNILIFERFREEIYKGRSLKKAIDLGFERAWSAILDSNLTTLLICVILFTIGSSIIKGFAITLMAGTILSMFSAVFVSKNLFHFFTSFKPLQNLKLFGIDESKIGTHKNGAKIRNRK